MKLLIATHNKAKLHEIKEFLVDTQHDLVSLSDLKISQDVDEDGLTYEQNSQKKALFYSQLSGLPTISDDGGLEISALNGVPGVRSRRWLGYAASDEELIEHLKKVSQQLPEDDRSAKFVTVVTLAIQNGRMWSKRSEINGVIAKIPLENKTEGFPYRSFFFLPKLNKFYHDSELSADENKKYNHRRSAVRSLIPILHDQIF